jgi:hypothetical protein
MGENIDPIALANLVISTLTAVSAIFIAFLALRHTAKPKIDVLLLNSKDDVLDCGSEVMFIFEVYNVGYWYAAAPALNITLYCNFDPAFDPVELRYGSIQEYLNKHVRVGKGGLKYIRAKGLKLSQRGEAEKVYVRSFVPKQPGRYRIKATAFSDEGTGVTKEYRVKCDSWSLRS